MAKRPKFKDRGPGLAGLVHTPHPGVRRQAVRWPGNDPPRVEHHRQGDASRAVVRACHGRQQLLAAAAR